jgi:signal transduction histidine kinase
LEAVDLEAVSRDAIAAATTQNQAFPPEIIKAADSGSDSSAWLAWAHRDRLEQALINLLGNASKYSAADQPIRIRLERQGDELTLSIEDQGIGIPLEEQNSIYEPFFRGSNSGPQEGSGLGLPIVKALVESMGGRLQLWSRPNQGSRFTILLPRADANSAPSERLT